MEIFILAVVAHGGLHSLYELQARAGLQPGGVQVALRRLESGGLLERTEQQRRRRRVINVTPEGARVLVEQWRSCVRDYPDIESVLRAATVGLLMDDLRTTDSYLVEMAAKHEGQGNKQPGNELQPGKSPMEFYAWTRWLWEARRHQTVAGVLRQIVGELEKPQRS
jgi:DNA-binding MarR family transcriptional regulator